MKFGLLVATVLLVSGAAFPAAAADGHDHTRRAASVTLHGPKKAVEGDRIAFVVRVPAARQAKSLTLETETTDIFGQPEWTALRRTAVAATTKHVLRATVTGVNRQRFRAVVAYRDGRLLRSTPVGVTVWRWIPLTSIESYYEAGGILDKDWESFAMNGQVYKGWSTYTQSVAWESRYTLGRHCTKFRGVYGVTDDSADGSTAQISVATDGATVYTSRTLVPGTTHKHTITIDRPYRIAISATNPTAESGLHAFPAIGDAEFLCTGV